MSSLNKAMIIGRLGQDPETRFTKSNTAVCTLSIATSDRYKDSKGEWQEKTQWHRVIAWGRLAEICDKYLNKGSQVYIEGPIQTNQWEDKNGQKRYTTEIKALSMQMLDSKGDNRPDKGQPNTKPDDFASQNEPADFGSEEFDEANLPF